MTLLDSIITIVLLYHAILGMRKGLVLSLCDLGALVGGVFAALHFYKQGVIMLQQSIGMKETIASFISFIIIWAVVFFSLLIVGRILSKMANFAIIRPLNMIGGSFFGGMKGLFYMIPILIPLSQTNLDLYHSSTIAKPLNTYFGKHILSQHKVQSVFSSLSPKEEVQKEEILKDPNINKLQEALESDDLDKLDDVLSEL